MKKEKILKLLISILLVILPILDMLRTTNFKDIEIFNIAIIELINIILILSSLIITFFRIDKKRFIKLFLYYFVVFIYLILHYKHIITFNTSIYSFTNFSFLTESFYIFRIFILPITLMFILINNSDIFNKKYYFKIVKIIISIISFSIIILNILKLSYISYSPDKKLIEANMFDYIFYKGDFKMLSSRGWFDSANSLSAVLFMLFPINIYLLFFENKKYNLILFISQAICMILVGTKTSSLGWFLISSTILVCYLITTFLKYDKLNENIFIKYVISFTILTVYLCISPFMLNIYRTEKVNLSIKNKDAYLSLGDNLDIENFKDVFYKYQDEYMIASELLELYPLESDYSFWYRVAKRDKSINVDNRIMKIDIIKRIESRNNNKLDKWLGLGYTLNFMDLERDYVNQFYLFGIIGLILLIGPFIYIFIKNIYLTIINFKNKFKLETICLAMAPLMGLIIAYYSGHVYSAVSPIMYLAMFLSLYDLGGRKYENKCCCTNL